MTKKQFIWLGIRIIGFYWLLRLILTIVMLLWLLGHWLISTFTDSDGGNMFATVVIYLFQVPVPLVLSIYFLFFGKLIYKIINRFVRSRPEDLSGLAGYCYCETITRFAGLWCIGMTIKALGLSLWVPLQSALIFYFTQPQRFQEHGLSAFLRQYRNISVILSMALYLLIATFGLWYFLKHGKFFINLLNRLWLGKNEQDLNQNPVNPVNPV